MAAGENKEEIQTSGLHNLPQDLLIKILCGVNHEDLKQLLLVSKPFTEATSIAKRLHFAYSTPTKVRAFRSSSPVDFELEAKEIETPGAPLRGLPSSFGRGPENELRPSKRSISRNRK
ncbi:F-box protein SKIP27 [Linum perenne]